MKIERDGVALGTQLKRNDLDSLEKILRDNGDEKPREISPKISQEWQITNNNYSALPHKELNNNIGILQIAQRALQNILNNSNITLDGVFREINNAQFLGNSVFAPSMILQDSGGELLFDANRILSIMPSDERDLYIFKKALKNEVDFIAHSLQNLQSTNMTQDSALYGAENVSDYLTSNAMLFAKAHNTAGLISRIDALLL